LTPAKSPFWLCLLPVRPSSLVLAPCCLVLLAPTHPTSCIISIVNSFCIAAASSENFSQWTFVPSPFFSPQPLLPCLSTMPLEHYKAKKEKRRQGDREERVSETGHNGRQRRPKMPKTKTLTTAPQKHPSHPLHHPQPRPLNNAPRSHDTPVSHLLGFRFIGAARKTATRRRQQRHPISMASSSSAFFRLATPEKRIDLS